MSDNQPPYNVPHYPSYTPPPPPRPNSIVYPPTYDYQTTPVPPPRPSTAYIAHYASDMSHGQSSSSSWSHPQQFPTRPEAPPMSNARHFAASQSAMFSQSPQLIGRHGASSYSQQDEYRTPNYSTGPPSSLLGENIVPGSVIPSMTLTPEPSKSTRPRTSNFDPRPFPTVETQPNASSNFPNSETGSLVIAPLRSSSLHQPYFGHAQAPNLPTPKLTTPTDFIRVHPFPTVESLTQASAKLDSWADAHQIAWAQDVLRLVERHWQQNSNADHFEQPSTPPSVTQHLSVTLQHLLDTAAPIIIAISDSDIKAHASLALYLKGKLLSSGACSAVLPKDKRQSFEDFEKAARMGEKRAWHRLGKDYEGVNDFARAGDCYDYGARAGDCESAFKIQRMGMAYLLGQLNLSPDPATGLYFLHQSSNTATIDIPQASYVYGMLLAGDITLQTNIPPNLIIPPTSPPTDAFLAQQNLARESIERAAYLNYPAAQFKLGQMYEHADLSCVYDPTASVAWYMFASQNGHMEADMALSKWFLCGAEGHFPKNEGNAKMYAEKAARNGHPNASFALGYYNEIGVGTEVDLEQARKWYEKAAQAGNAEAPARLAALSLPVPTAISMNEHQSRLNDTLVRKHTTAKLRSDRNIFSRPLRQQNYQSHPTPLPDYSLTNPQSEFGQMNQKQMPTAFTSPPPVAHAQFPPSSLTSATDYHPHQPQPPYTLQDPPCKPSRPLMHQHQYSSSSTSTAASEARSKSSDAPRPISVADYRQMNAGGSSVSDLPVPSTSSSTSVSTPSSGPVRRVNGGVSGVMEKKEKEKGPQTFAEMGFVSKPVEEDSCVIM
ncbi:chitin synthase regulator 3 [Cryptococcus deuterogattii MMRL2647]|nr:chitin synthase regulator 3 [Cryptococcus deuterogattii MMRL2647]